MQATLTMRDHAGTGTLDAYLLDRYIGQIARMDTRYAVVLPSPAHRIEMYDVLSDAVRALETVAAEPEEEEEPYVFDGFDAEAEYAASVAGWDRPDPMEEYEPPFYYHPLA